jgi:hypothetical protein
MIYYQLIKYTCVFMSPATISWTQSMECHSLCNSTSLSTFYLPLPARVFFCPLSCVFSLLSVSQIQAQIGWEEHKIDRASNNQEGSVPGSASPQDTQWKVEAFWSMTPLMALASFRARYACAVSKSSRAPTIPLGQTGCFLSCVFSKEIDPFLWNGKLLPPFQTVYHIIKTEECGSFEILY